MSSQSQLTLSAADYAVFGVTLGISAAIGIFYAIKDRRSDEGTEGYLLGGRSMGMVPVALSLTVSFMSAATVLGTPAEVYVYGTMYWWILLAMLCVIVITAEVYLPVYFRNNVTTIFEYAEMRFNKLTKNILVIMYLLVTLIYLGIAIYGPSLTLSTVTGFNLWAAILISGLTCTFYTTLGGFKAVIWTDVFQALVMIMGFLAVTIQGSIKQGGYEKIWATCEKGGRIDFLRFDFDPRYRHTVWSVVVGGTFVWSGSYAIAQSQIQRCLSCKSLKQAKGALYLNWLGLVTVVSFCAIIGTIIYSYYHECDPLKSGAISAYDQLLPYLSLELFKNYPGVSGLVMSSIFSGSLSTVSTGINSMAGVIVQDFLRAHTNWKENKYTIVTKGAVLLFGVICIGMAFLASNLGSILQTALSITSLTSGPGFACFALGMMCPFVNSLGVITGMIVGFAVGLWIYIGSLIYPPLPIFSRALTTTIDGCSVANTSETTLGPKSMIPTSQNTFPQNDEPYPEIADAYAISYMYYSALTFCVTTLIAVPVSLLSGGWKNRKSINPLLLWFFFDYWLFTWLPKSFRKCMRFGIDVDETKVDYEVDGTYHTNCFKSESGNTSSESVGSLKKSHLGQFDKSSNDNKQHSSITKL